MPATLKWHGHATIEIRFDGKIVLVDPYFTGNAWADIRPEQAHADYILVTHGHYDHVGDGVSIAMRTGAPVIANPEIAAWFARQGVKTQSVMMDKPLDLPFGRLQRTEATHTSKLPDGADGGTASGFIITTPEGKMIYLAGDTGLFDSMKWIGEQGIDFAALPIGGYYTMDPDEALRAVKTIHPKVVLPIHYSTMDKIRQDPQKWAARVQSETPTKVVVLKPGESTEI